MDAAEVADAQFAEIMRELQAKADIADRILSRYEARQRRRARWRRWLGLRR